MITAGNHHASLADWLDYLETRHHEPIQLGLERVRAVATQLGLTSFDAVVITVAGTNGKGSTVAALDAIYSKAGYSVACYTSPHLLRFNERIVLNQQPVSDEALCYALTRINSLPESAMLTYFEMTTLAAFLIFQDSNPDVILLEVGMGGRLDATNIIDADLAIITTIDLDHQAFLGETLEAIGYEKAGIFRTGKPAVYADVNPPLSIIAHAEHLNVPVLYFEQNYVVSIVDDEMLWSFNQEEPIRLPRPSIHEKAAAGAIMATHQLQSRLPVTLSAYQDAMQSVFIPGRQHGIDGVIKTILDVAHNPQAVSLLASFLERQVIQGRVHAVFSGLKDKDLCGLMKPMQSIVDAWYPALLTGPRAATEQMLKDVLWTAGVTDVILYPDPATAYRAAKRVALPGDWVVVYGSFLTVSAVMQEEQ